MKRYLAGSATAVSYTRVMGVMEKVRELAAIDVRALAVLRIMLGVLILLDLANRAKFLSVHYGSESVVPHALLRASDYFWPLSLHLLSSSTLFQAFLFAIAGAFALMLIVGWKTRLAVIASWFLLLSLHGANPFVLHGADTELRVLMFFSLFVPLGARWSFDAKKHRTGTFVSTYGTAALLLQVGFLYLFAALHKTGIEWQDGSAVWYALSAKRYASELAAPLLQYPELLAALSFGILYLQLSSFALLFSPFFTSFTRTLAATLLILMQFGFLIFLTLGFFPLISITALLPFLPKKFWDFIERLARRRTHV